MVFLWFYRASGAFAEPRKAAPEVEPMEVAEETTGEVLGRLPWAQLLGIGR